MTALWYCENCETNHHENEALFPGKVLRQYILCMSCMQAMGPYRVMDYYSELDTEEEYLEELEGDEN